MGWSLEGVIGGREELFGTNEKKTSLCQVHGRRGKVGKLFQNEGD